MNILFIYPEKNVVALAFDAAGDPLNAARAENSTLAQGRENERAGTRYGRIQDQTTATMDIPVAFRLPAGGGGPVFQLHRADARWPASFRGKRQDDNVGFVGRDGYDLVGIVIPGRDAVEYVLPFFHLQRWTADLVGLAVRTLVADHRAGWRYGDLHRGLDCLQGNVGRTDHQGLAGFEIFRDLFMPVSIGQVDGVVAGRDVGKRKPSICSHGSGVLLIHNDLQSRRRSMDGKSGNGRDWAQVKFQLGFLALLDLDSLRRLLQEAVLKYADAVLLHAEIDEQLPALGFSPGRFSIDFHGDVVLTGVYQNGSDVSVGIELD